MSFSGRATLTHSQTWNQWMQFHWVKPMILFSGQTFHLNTLSIYYYYGDYYASQQCLYLLTSAWRTFFDHLIASWKLQAYQLPLLSNTETDLLYNSCQFVPEWLLLLLNLPCWSQFHLYFHCFLALCHSYLNFLFDEKL